MINSDHEKRVFSFKCKKIVHNVYDKFHTATHDLKFSIIIWSTHNLEWVTFKLKILC